MKNILNKAFLLIGIAFLLNSCAEETPGTELRVSFPDLQLVGSTELTFSVGDTFEDPGFSATFGIEDITTEVVVTSNLDTSTPGIYSISYTVEATNEVGETSSVLQQRLIAVVDASAFDVDLSGNWLGEGFSGSPSPKEIKSLGGVWYSVPDIIGSGNGIFAKFAYLGNNVIQIPDQPGGFGNVNTTGAGTSAVLVNNNTFVWTVFIGCCGNFGPITWARQ